MLLSGMLGLDVGRKKLTRIADYRQYDRGQEGVYYVALPEF